MGNELETEIERAIQEAQEETDEQTKVNQVGTGALEARTRTRRIVVKKRMLVFYGVSKAQKRRKR